MINFDYITKKNITEYNRNWQQIPDHPNKSVQILIIGGSRSGKTNALVKLISRQPNTNKICLHAKDPY